MSLTATEIIRSVKVNSVNQSIPYDVISACERTKPYNYSCPLGHLQSSDTHIQHMAFLSSIAIITRKHHNHMCLRMKPIRELHAQCVRSGFANIVHVHPPRFGILENRTGFS